MSKKKSIIKSDIDTCFFCGKPLCKIEDKKAHRIDLKRNINQNNVIILCETCELALQRAEKRIFNFGFDFDIVERYFKNKSRKYKNLIIYKILKLKRKFEIQQSCLEK